LGGDTGYGKSAGGRKMGEEGALMKIYFEFRMNRVNNFGRSFNLSTLIDSVYTI